MKLALAILCLSYVSAQNITETIKNTVVAVGDKIKLPSLGRTGYHKPPKDSNEIQGDYDTVKIITGFKYPVEEYSLSTDDGYILTIFRIPCKKSKNQISVLLMSDFYASSDYWVLSGPKYGLPYYLSNLGYDVWLGNNRGGKYGQKHKVLKKNDPAFWYYSFHEWGIYDLPAIIDFILDKIKCDKLSYIGWGYGATEFFVMASERPKYMDKIKNMQAFAPLVCIENTRSQVEIATYNIDEESLYDIAGRDALIPNDLVLALAGRDRCLKLASNKVLCDYLEPLAHEGYNIDIPGYPEIACDPPIQGSIRFFLHILQLLKYGFRNYDHGLASNLLLYGEKCPPKYNLKAADVPIALYYSDDDNIAVSKDVLHLATKLPKLIRAFKIKAKHFGFVDFPLSKVGPENIHNWVGEVLDRYKDY